MKAAEYKSNGEEACKMNIKPMMLLLAALFFSAAVGMPYLMLKIAEKLAVMK